MEQRVNSLEEELKVLKSQIKAVLLDIKDYMSTGTGQPYAPAPSGGHAEAAPVEGHAGPGPITVSSYGGPGPNMGGGYVGGGAPVGGYYGHEPPAGTYHEREAPATEIPEPVHVVARRTETGAAEHASSGGNGDRAGSSSRAAEREAAGTLTGGGQTDKGRSGQDDGCVQNGGRDDQVLDLLTVSVLAQWLARAMPAVGREQLGKLVEIYDITGNLQPRLKDTMLLLADLCAGENPEVGPATTEAVPAAVSVQLLIELDGLLRYRKGAVESVVMSMLLDKAEATKKDGHG
jgi:hypothetical protein